MRKIKILLIFMSLVLLVSCGEKEKIDKSYDNTTNEAIEGYIYDKDNNRYVNSETGIWYSKENNLNIIPAEEYIEEGKIVNKDDFSIENRNNDVWELKEVKEVMVEVRDGFYSLSDPVYDMHYRMDRNWYYEQVKALNELDNIEIVRWHEIFKLPIYTDSGK